MSEYQRLQQEISEYQRQWNMLSERIARLQEQMDLETRVDEKLRLQAVIGRDQAERERVAALLRTREAELINIEKAALVSEARRLERNQAYIQGVHTWEAIHRLDPHDPQIEEEIQRLQALQQRAQRLNELIQQLTQRMREIRPIYMQLVRRVKQMLEGSMEDGALLALVDNFLTNQLSAADLTTMWQELVEDNAPAATPTMNFRALADRMKRSEIVFFLGSDIPRLFDPTLLDAAAVVATLACQASYDDFGGSLSMIAEYYQMKPEYGRSSLVRNLHALLPDIAIKVPLYDLLASIEQPLVLISAAYDTLLERAFHRADKPYVLITSLLGTDSDADVGQILLQYSHRDAPESPCLEQDLSHLDLLGQRYSLIYKIRGYLGPHTNQGIHQQNALTLSEENYFTFARYMDKLIPNYVVKQFAGRGFWFLGYTPTHWEDRLIANALLYRRRHHIEPAYTVSNDINRFEETYWERHGVHRYALDLKDFVQKLEANFV